MSIEVCGCGLLKQKKAGTRMVDGVERCNNCNRPVSISAAAITSAEPIPPEMTSTLDTVPGWRVVKSFGIVTALATGRLWTAGSKSEAALSEGMTEFRSEAAQMGANAIVGVRATPFGVGRSGVATSDAVGMLVMGDAVTVEREDVATQ